MTVLEFNPTFGYCDVCKEIHSLGIGNARQYAYELMEQLEQKKRLDFEMEETNEKFSTDYLFGEALGQMFGVLECVNSNGDVIVLKAFSCQYNGEWLVPGWVPPVLDLRRYYEAVPVVDKKIKSIGAKLLQPGLSSEVIKELKANRKKLSQGLMKEIHSFYALKNFKGESRSLRESFLGAGGIPTGTADCCAPKLLNYAAENELHPLGLIEFYWGRENRSKTRKHSEFYPCCKSKCQPILGYMLCGL